jgi:hypothetical protein
MTVPPDVEVIAAFSIVDADCDFDIGDDEEEQLPSNTCAKYIPDAVAI